MQKSNEHPDTTNHWRNSTRKILEQRAVAAEARVEKLEELLKSILAARPGGISFMIWADKIQRLLNYRKDE